MTGPGSVALGMATRSRPASRTTSRSKRRPAARRKPAARRGGSRIRWDKVGRIALTLVLAAVLYSYLNPAIDFVKTYTATTAAKAEFHEKLRENALRPGNSALLP